MLTIFVPKRIADHRILFGDGGLANLTRNLIVCAAVCRNILGKLRHARIFLLVPICIAAANLARLLYSAAGTRLRTG